MRLNPIATSVVSVLAFGSLPADSVAQQLDQTVCSVLASKLTPDLSYQTSAETRQKVYRSLISSESYKAFGAARNTTLDAGLTVVGYVDATLGTTSDENSWETNWSKFVNMTGSEFALSASATSLNNKWNPELLSALLQGCTTTSFYGQLVAINTGNDGFTVKLNGIGKWELSGVKASPADASLTCSGDEKATEDNPITKYDDRLLTCSKDPRATISVTVSSSQGDAGPFMVLSVEDSLRQQIKDGSSVLGGAIIRIEKKLAELDAKQAVQADSIKSATAAIQLNRAELSYMIVPNSTSCPAGWENFGNAGFLLQTANVDRAALGRGGPYGGGEWTWTHPYLCKRQ